MSSEYGVVENGSGRAIVGLLSEDFSRQTTESDWGKIIFPGPSGNERFGDGSGGTSLERYTTGAPTRATIPRAFVFGETTVSDLVQHEGRRSDEELVSSPPPYPSPSIGRPTIERELPQEEDQIFGGRHGAAPREELSSIRRLGSGKGGNVNGETDRG